MVLTPSIDLRLEWTNRRSGRRERLRLDRDRRTVLLETYVATGWTAGHDSDQSDWDRPASHALRRLLEARATATDRNRLTPLTRELSRHYA